MSATASISIWDVGNSGKIKLFYIKTNIENVKEVKYIIFIACWDYLQRAFINM